MIGKTSAVSHSIAAFSRSHALQRIRAGRACRLAALRGLAFMLGYGRQSALGLQAERKSVADYLIGGGWELIDEYTEVESGERTDRAQGAAIRV
jgi:hypothetical protein